MSTSVIEPGTRLAGRYRLEERISDAGGSSLWKAIDEILARAVAVRTFDPEFPRIGEVVTSARAASRLTDPRLTQVFDADDSGESAYVVSEWVVGETLEQMLAKAPLEPGRAATLLYEAAEAMAAAHAAGLAHLCLTPRDLVWTTGGTVKLLGIATDAVLGDCYSDDPAAADVRGLGRMLYAALTAHWPGDEKGSALPAAPMSDDGVPQAPRQVQAGISHAVDAIVCRCLGLGTAEPLATPADLAKALRGVPRTPLPLFAGLGNAQPPAPSR
ncbi:protein kinase family protein [Actinomadura fibrosa]|uniref:protein kinase family protein n=1 Tax=Actinomadura fibrosa TaxID=111802 RepID=UPI001F5EFE73|nr:protein kinase family protein [Actinomadura fibrosa]